MGKKERKVKACPHCGNAELEPFVILYNRPTSSKAGSLGGTLGRGLKCKKCGMEVEFDSHVFCVVCNGDVIADVRIEYDPTTGPPIYGPGSRNQFKKETKGYFCTRCGIKYQFPPPPAEVIANIKAKDPE